MSVRYNVGDIWICPRCECNLSISDTGIDHKCKHSWIKYSTDDLKTIGEYSKRQEKIWFYEHKNKLINTNRI